MKIAKEIYFLEKGSKEDKEIFEALLKQVRTGIKRVVWPEGNSQFIINPVAKENGVVPIKINFIEYLQSKNWLVQKTVSLVKGNGPGKLDALYQHKKGNVALEWETGNISSSHRAINKMAIALFQKNIIGGIIVVPIRHLARYLTDRIGNLEELAPYFPLWENLNIARGLLVIIGIDYDGTSEKVAFIPKGTDGNAKKKKKEKS